MKTETHLKAEIKRLQQSVEAQARELESKNRELEIQNSLDIVRARTMAMHRSDELTEASIILEEEVRKLGIQSWGCAFHIYDETDTESIPWDLEWFTSAGGMLPFYKTPREYVFLKYYEESKKGKQLFIQEIGPEVIEQHYNYLKTLPVLGKALTDLHNSGVPLPERQIDHVAFFKHGHLLFITYEPVPEAHDIFIRFAKVFDQTYTRFLELQKAEAQAREAEIQLALERVRARTMSMHKSSELNKVVAEIFHQMETLGFAKYGCELILCNEETNQMEYWHMYPNQSYLPECYYVPKSIDPVFEKQWEAWQQGKPEIIVKLEGKEKWDFDTLLFEKTDFGKIPEETKNWILEETVVVFSLVTFKYGLLEAIDRDELKEDKLLILKRFAKVFEQTYTRFLDLQKAEAQAKEAKIELSLERIRAQVTAMRESDELLEIVVNMRKEFVSLGHEAHYFWHMRWLPDTYSKAMTSGDGTQIGMVMSLPRHIHGDIPAVAAWEKGDEPTHILAMDVDLAVEYVDKMIKLGDFERVDPQAPTLDDIRHIGGLTFVMARTTHGEIGYSLPGKVEHPPQESIDTLTRFAGVFDLAYKRFEDLKKAEANAQKAAKDLIIIKEAKKKAENALKELKAAQEQLVQQEKLASLGQLTAGIAHEIKNPLNFVNNFSELSVELIEEVFEELVNLEDSDTKEEIRAILEDVKNNLSKVHEHGKRADGIVKSMLQHSRASNNKMEPKAINPIIKEFVNLAFHGMRAAKNPINVTIDLQLDEQVGELNIISEDFSRVILNLCNNAFDAMREKLNSPDFINYTPKLTVVTKASKSKIQIEIKDNGSGISKEIQDKVLQPFFTTKKGTEGTGLGLSISHDIIKAHGGEIKIKSEEGIGTTFFIQLPLN